MSFLEKGSIIGDRYKVERLVEKTMYNAIYIVIDTKSDPEEKYFANEYLPQEIIRRNENNVEIVGSYEHYESGRKKFLKDIDLYTKLNYSGIANIYEVVEDNNTAYIISEFFGNGMPLNLYKEQMGRVSLRQVVKLLEPMTESLLVLHKKNLWQGNISGENIILSHGKAILCKYGMGYNISELYTFHSDLNQIDDIYNLALMIVSLLINEPLNKIKNINTYELEEKLNKLEELSVLQVEALTSVLNNPKNKTLYEFYTPFFKNEKASSPFGDVFKKKNTVKEEVVEEKRIEKEKKEPKVEKKATKIEMMSFDFKKPENTSGKENVSKEEKKSASKKISPNKKKTSSEKTFKPDKKSSVLVIVFAIIIAFCLGNYSMIGKLFAGEENVSGSSSEEIVSKEAISTTQEPTITKTPVTSTQEPTKTPTQTPTQSPTQVPTQEPTKEPELEKKIPLVKGKNVKSAKEIIKNAGFTNIIVKKRYSKKKKGIVISQTNGQNIILIVSKGVKTIKVPNLVGKNISSARKILKKKGLKYRILHRYYSSVYSENEVMRTYRAGKRVKKGTTISLNISIGKKPETNNNYSRPKNNSKSKKKKNLSPII